MLVWCVGHIISSLSFGMRPLDPTVGQQWRRLRVMMMATLRRRERVFVSNRPKEYQQRALSAGDTKYLRM